MRARGRADSRAAAAAAMSIVFATIVAGCMGPSTSPARLVLATTTSVHDSGLLAFILPDFEAKHNAKVAVVAVGSGIALEMCKRGDGDVCLVHSPAAEQAFMADGSGVARWQIMYNSFAVVGPSADPAGVGNATNASDALARIQANASVFVSRGDESGTHAKEKQLWAAIGVNTSSLPSSWYKATGQGMGATLSIAFQYGGYTLTDEGTYWSMAASIGPTATGGLSIHLGGLGHPSTDLKNTYSVIQLNVTRTPSINAPLATAFATWITSPETAGLIGSFSVGGHQLFFPDPKRS